MRTRFLTTLSVLLLLIALAACGSSAPSEPPTVDMTGVWAGTVQAPRFGLREDGRFRLTQEGAGITGTVEAPLIGSVYVTVGSVTGTVSGNRVRLTLTFDPATGHRGGGDLDGTVTGDEFSGDGRLRSIDRGVSGNVTFEATRQ